MYVTILPQFYVYYLELTTSQFHIFDGQDTDDMRKVCLEGNDIVACCKGLKIVPQCA